MNDQLKKVMTYSIVIIFTLSILLGASIVLLGLKNKEARSYKESMRNILSSIGTSKRLAIIDSVDPINRTIIVTMTTKQLGQYRRVELLVPDTSIIKREDLITDKGIITGFTPGKRLYVQDLKPGDSIFVRMLFTQGKIRATNIIVGLPFVRP